MRKNILFGYSNFVSKKGTPTTILFCGHSATPDDNARGFFGIITENVFIYDDAIKAKLNRDVLSKEFSFVYGEKYGKPAIIGIEFDK